MSGPASTDSVAGSSYGELIQEQLLEERNRKESLERRGASVLTASTSLGTLLFAVSATTDQRIPWAEPRGLAVLAAIVSLILAALFGALTNWLDDYEELDPDEVSRLLKEEHWSADAVVGDRRTAEFRGVQLRDMRGKNDAKATKLKISIGLQLAGVVAVAAAALLQLTI